MLKDDNFHDNNSVTLSLHDKMRELSEGSPVLKQLKYDSVPSIQDTEGVL